MLPSSTVGPLVVPAPVGAVDAQFAEPTTDRLLSYVSHWLTYGLNGKLATMSAPPSPGGAIPVANRWTNAPSSMYLKQPLPALFVFWSGQSKYADHSTVQQKRIRDFSVLYVFSRVVNRDNLRLWSGLVSTIDALMGRAFYRLSHPTYAFDSTHEVGTDIRYMNNWLDVTLVGGNEGFLQAQVQESTRNLSTAAGSASASKPQGGIQEGYPSWSGTVRISELVGYDDVEDPADVMPDMLATLKGCEGGDEPVELLQRVLEAPPDGSERLQQEQD